MAVATVIPARAESKPVRRAAARLMRCFRVLYGRARNRFYRKKLVGTDGVLESGVAWRFVVPESRRGSFCDTDHTHVQLLFDVPYVTGTILPGHHAWQRRYDLESFYEQGLRSFAETLARRGYELAAPGDPEGFFVRPSPRPLPRP